MTSNKPEVMVKYLNIIPQLSVMAKKDNTFLLLSLEEDKAKKLANVISSEACRRILDFLAQKEATETEVAKGLNIPISTAHYNLKQLLEAGLVKADEFHYSEKGREVNHYSIANKYIIIAPKTTEGLANKLKRILPVFAIVAATGLAIQLIGDAAQKTSAQAAYKTAESAGVLAQEAQQAAMTVQQPGIAMWFAIGALFALIVYLAYDALKDRFR